MEQKNRNNLRIPDGSIWHQFNDGTWVVLYRKDGQLKVKNLADKSSKTDGIIVEKPRNLRQRFYHTFWKCVRYVKSKLS